jgi:glycerophosphoryl diester phosphodiesterase
MTTRPGPAWLVGQPIAHRGLHDRTLGRPENSMAAFRAAIAGDYAIECDLQPSTDGVPMVFHDDDLDRMTGVAGNIRDRPASELAGLRLSGTQEPIPSLADLLADTAGRVPLVLELKSQPGRDAGFAHAVAGLLKSYDGPAAVMSFEPALMADFGKAAPELPRGLVAEGDWRSFVTVMQALRLCKAHFISYSIADLPTPAPVLAHRILGLPLICWTVRTEADRRKAERWTDQITFEGFTP